MKTYYDPLSSNTSASSSENIRFKNTFIRLVDDITSMTSQLEKNNFNKVNKQKTYYSPNKINSYKLNLLINRDTPDTKRTARLFSPQKNVKLDFDNIKGESKYKNIFENGLSSFKSAVNLDKFDKYDKFDKNHATESKLNT
jgi:hypothetical protein